MLVVAMEREPATIDRSFWEPLGMEASDSFAVGFDGVRVDGDGWIGGAGDYERSPWFSAGAARFVAVQTGGIERLVDELTAFARRRGTGGDAVQTTRLGECVVAARTAAYWVRACADAWAAYDRRGDPASAAELLATVDGARSAVERAALDVLERVERAVGARGLLAPEPFAALVRDLRMYLRQPAPDLAVLRVGEDALARSAPH
jgi:alkylation response protein AidB-like acyl-CoA dehydrogenase